MNVFDLLAMLGRNRDEEFEEAPPSARLGASDNFAEVEDPPVEEESPPSYEELHDRNERTRAAKFAEDRGSGKFSFEGDMVVPFPERRRGRFSRVGNFDSRSANYRDPTELEIDKLRGYITRGEGYADKHFDKIQKLLGVEQLERAHKSADQPDYSQMEKVLDLRKTAQEIENNSPEARSEADARDLIKELVESDKISPEAASGLFTLKNKRGLTYRELVNIISRAGLATREGRRDTGDKFYKRLSVGIDE